MVGIKGGSDSWSGVYGVSSSGSAVRGDSTSSTGVLGTTAGSAPGVTGLANGADLSLMSNQLCGVFGCGANSGGNAGRVGILGLSDTAGGVVGKSTSGAAVQGWSGSGTGGSFHSDAGAPLHLDPGSTAGPPTSGTFSLGDLYLGSGGALYLCTGTGTAGGSNPPTWAQIHVTQPIALQAGWNLVAGPGLTTDVIASQIAAAGGQVKEIAVWQNGKYTVWLPGSGQTPFLVPTTAGMQILVTSAVTWTPR